MLNKYSKIITQNQSLGAAHAMLSAVGIKGGNLKKPFVGIPKEVFEKYDDYKYPYSE